MKFTEEQRKAGQKAKEIKRKAMKEATKDYKMVWLDENWWVDLANSRGIRLPAMYLPATAKSLRKWAKRLSRTPFEEHYGCSPQKLIEKNPRTPLRAFVGQMLEP